MADRFLTLAAEDRREALSVAADKLDRPPHLLEKDAWVVFALEALFHSELRDRLVFKGGTSLSKVYHAIDRFSEDVDLTYDIREIADDLVKTAGGVLPPSSSQSKKWAKEIQDRLPAKITDEILPVIQRALGGAVPARIRADGDKAFLEYEALFQGTGYVTPRVLLEFGAKSTGEPCETRQIVCDAATHLEDLEFPAAEVRVMCAESTWWEKATAVHVFCHQGSFRGGDRFARHWYDLVKLDDSGHAQKAVDDRDLAAKVALRKSAFFVEKHTGSTISYAKAISGGLRLVPEGAALVALKNDYALMVEDGLFVDTPPSFDLLMKRCADLEKRANDARPSAGQ